MSFTVQRNGYGYGFEGLPIKLATAVLVVYLVLVLAHVIFIFICTNGQTYYGYSNMGEMLALAWNSAPAKELKNTSVGIERTRTWKHLVKVEQCAENRLQFVVSESENGTAHQGPRVGIKYSESDSLVTCYPEFVVRSMRRALP